MKNSLCSLLKRRRSRNKQTPVATNDVDRQTAQQPLVATEARQDAVQTNPTLSISFVNQSTSNTVYGYVTGLAINKNNAPYLLQADGKTPYFPSSPTSTGQPLQANCAIPLGGGGSTVTITIPPTAGGRVWFSIGTPLTFLINPGPALVEPSVTNASDPNVNIQWAFCEFTFDSSQLYANISYVDFVSVPIALQLTNRSGAVQTVSGMRYNGLDTICSQLQQQTKSDGVAGWGQCVVTKNGKNLRALSPNNVKVTNGSAFNNYFEPYVEQVWQRYATQQLSLNTTAVTESGTVNAKSGELAFGSESFPKPSTSDVLSCNSGPFATGADTTRNIIIPQLAAAFNRSTLTQTSSIPSPLGTFYQGSVTNHYARIVHANQIDGRGYAFPYDDVNPTDAGDQSGEVNDPNPASWVITVGGLEYLTFSQKVQKVMRKMRLRK